MRSSLQLPFQFDPQLLQEDLHTIQPEEWTPHYNKCDYGGDWRGAALRAPTGHAHTLFAGLADASDFTDTTLLGRCPNLRRVLATFACPLKAVRLLRLAPGAVIREHCDPGLGYEEGEVRLHLPILTNPGVEFHVAGERLHFEVGNCYYVNTSLPHRVSNRGSADRVHLVIDAEVNAWVHDVFRRSRAVPTLAPAPQGYEAFRTLLLSDAALQQTLHAIADEQEFLDAVVRMGRARGFAFDRAEVGSTRGFPAHAAGAPAACPPAVWLPVRVTYQDAGPRAEWVYFAARRYTEPFFTDTVRHALRSPLARTLRHQGPLAPCPGLAPSGFILHMSRCGSTLISQTLAALDRALVISEAPAIDEVLHAEVHAPHVKEDEQVQWLRAVVSALGQARAGQDLYFIKLDAWHIHKLPLIHRAFPATPWIFVYRDPIEVLVSQLRNPGKFALPGAMAPAMLDMSAHDITNCSREEWCVRVLAGFCRAALRFCAALNGLCVNYNQLPEAVWTTLATHWDITFSANDVARMRQAASFDAKHPASRFQSDADHKQRAATPTLRALADTMLTPLYRELESRRGAL
ncbi:MAG TPA: aspartyl/asparaginyl beta-hydroxylase domain-containing protein [Anaerolineales bacterium]